MRKQSLIAVAIVVAATSLGAESHRTPLAVVVGTADALGADYLPPATPPADAVFFEGEPLRLRLAIKNAGGTAEALSAAGSEPSQFFRVTATRSGTAVPLGLEFEPGMTKIFPAGQYHVESFRPQIMEATESLEWIARIDGAVPPGSYQLDVEALMFGGRSRKVKLPGSTFNFEVRPRAASTQPEILRREALRHLLGGRFAESRDTIARLLEIHPHSFVAHEIRSLVATAEGNDAEAQQASAQAAHVRASGLDTLFQP